MFAARKSRHKVLGTSLLSWRRPWKIFFLNFPIFSPVCMQTSFFQARHLLLIMEILSQEIAWSYNTDETSKIFRKSLAKIVKIKVTSAEALTSLWWVPLNARYFGLRRCLVQYAMKGGIPQHFSVFRSKMSQQHGYNTRNGYLSKVSKARTEWGRNYLFYYFV